MTATLKKISINTRLSDETPCYSADLCWDGQKVAEVSNHGHGGPDMVRVTKQDCFDAVLAFIKTLPPVPSGFEGMDDLAMDLELWCHIEVGKVEDRKRMLAEMRRCIKRSIVTSEDGQIKTYSLKGQKTITAADIASFKAKYPDKAILNEMPEADALEIFSRYA